MNKDSISKIKSIKNGNGISYILDEAHKVLNNPIVIFDMEYNLLAHTSCKSDDLFWCEFMNHGRLRAEIIDFLVNESFIDDVANSVLKNGITFLTSDKLKYNRIFGQLYNKNHEAVADLVMVEQNKFSPYIMDEISALCDVLTAELALIPYYSEYGQSYKEGIVKTLIEGSVKNIKTYSGHVANIDHGLKNIYAMVIDFSCGNKGHTQREYLSMLKAAQPLYDYYAYGNYIVALVSCKRRLTNDIGGIAKLNDLFDAENLFAGVSKQFENLFELKKYYLQAESALKMLVSNDNKVKLLDKGFKNIAIYKEKKTR